MYSVTLHRAFMGSVSNSEPRAFNILGKCSTLSCILDPKVLNFMLFVNCTTIITIQQIRPRILNSIENARRTISPSRDASTTSKTPCSPRFHLSSGPKAFDYSHLICAQWSGFQILISGIIFGTETNLDLRYRR